MQVVERSHVGSNCCLLSVFELNKNSSFNRKRLKREEKEKEREGKEINSNNFYFHVYIR